MKIRSLKQFWSVPALLLGVLATVPAQADYRSTVLSDSPAGYWRLGEFPATTADPYVVTNLGSLGPAANGAFAGYVARAEDGALKGSTDTAMRFWSAEGSRVNMGSASSFNFTGNGESMPFTLEIWAKPMSTPSGSQRLISNGSSGQGYGLTMQGNNAVRLTAFGVADVTSDVIATPFASNQWYHIVATRGLSTVTFYVNGVKVGATKSLSTVNTTANALTLGRTAAGGEAFTGLLDEAAVYSAVLTPERILAHYEAGQNNGTGYADVVLADNPIGYWRLNEPRKPESTTVIANTGSIGTSGDGAVFGSANSVTGGVAGALSGDANTAIGFAGTDGKINVPQSAELNTASYTVECWARMDNWNNAHQSPVTSRFSGSSTDGYIFYAAPFSGAPRWEFWNGTGTAWQNINSGVADVQIGKWTHLVGTYDAATRMKLLYVDGQIAAGGINVVQSRNLTTPLRIGAGATELLGGSFFWNGAVDEVAVYPSALSPDRVQAHYQAATGTPAGMAAAPTVAAEPVNQTNWAPYSVTLSAAVKGSWPMQLQWYRIAADGVTRTVVPNGTNMALTLNPTDGTMTGNYVLTATNALGGIESAMAWVEIVPLTSPTFTLTPPSTVPVYTGGTAGIPAFAEGTPTIAYQWQSNSVDIVGATNPIIAISGVKASYGTALFRAKATNPGGSAFTDPAQLTVLTAPATTYAAVATAMNPLAFWRLGEPSGQLAFDYWGGHPAIYNNAAQGMTPGALTDNDDGAVMFAGTPDSYVRSLESAPFNFPGAQSFTLSAWVKASAFPATGAAARIFSNWQTSPQSAGYGFGFLGNTILRFTGFGIKDVNASVPKFETEQWYHVAAVRSNAMVYLYIDGALVNSDTLTEIRSSSQPLHIGGNPAGTEMLTGMVDEAAVFNRPLSSAEIAALYVARYGSLNPPTITKQPAPASLYAGGTARFDVVATGSQPMRYQWKANGSNIANATNSTLVISNVTAGNNGVNYTVTVSNSAGNQTSDNASLTVRQPAGYTSAVVADKPVAYWRLGEANGPVAYDSFGSFNGRDNSLVLYGTPGALLNDTDTAATFDGATSRVEVPYSPAINPPVYTVEAWAKVTGNQGTYRAVVSARDEQAGVYQKGFIIYATAGDYWSFWTSVGAGWQAIDGPAIVLDEWTHLAAVYDGQVKSFYVNGVLVGSETIVAEPNNLRPFRIGEGRNEFDPGDYRFTGSIDEVAIYNTALTGDRIDYHYNFGKYGSSTPPFFTVKPVGNTYVAGQTATLTSRAGGSPALAYQWIKDGSPIPGATQPNLLITGASYADSGTYSVTVTNALGSTNSGPARIAVGPAPQFANATNGLVLHLKFDNSYNDASGRNNNGTPVGAPQFVPGRIGSNALRYSTDTNSFTYNYVSLGTPADLQFSSNVSFSVSYWIRFTGSPGDLPVLCNAVQSYSNFGFTFAPSWFGGGWSWSLGNSTSYIGVYGPDNSINDGTWHHLVHTFDRAGNGITYLNGVEVDARPVANAGDIDSGAAVNIGQDPTGTYAIAGSADLDDLAVWRRVLTPYETLGIYNAGKAGRSLDAYGPVQLGIESGPDGLSLVWQAGKLMEAENLTGPYTPVSGAVAPFHKVTLTPGRKFFRVEL